MPKIVGSTLEEHRRDVRGRLFESLNILMREKGFDSITMSEIAAKAGVGRTAVYNFFADKESILIGLITYETSNYLVRLQEAIATTDDPVTQLKMFIRHQADLDPSFHLTAGADLRSVLSPETLKELREHAVAVEMLLREIVSSGIASGDFANLSLETTLPYVNASIWGTPLPREHNAAREQALVAKEQFILRGLGAAALG